MFKRFALRKLLIVSLSFLILLIIYIFPTKDEYNIHTTLSYTNTLTMPIYLLDSNDLVSRLEVINTSSDTESLVKEVIDNLTINKKSHYVPSNFKKIIPENTRILSQELEGTLLKINFSKEFLNVSLDNEEKLLEAIIYSLTEIKGIKQIMIFVEGEKLKELPNSKIVLPNILDRSYGINKVYDIDSLKDVSKITTYYVNKNDSMTYYTPITLVSNQTDEKIKVIIERLKSSPTFETNLISYLASTTKLIDYEILDNSVNLNFNYDILSLDDSKIIEEVKYSIALSVRDTYNVEKTIFYVENEPIDVLFY